MLIVNPEVDELVCFVSDVMSYTFSLLPLRVLLTFVLRLFTNNINPQCQPQKDNGVENPTN